jgi:hypothetical protein
VSLIAYWKFDEALAADTAVDSVGGYNLTPNGPPPVATGRFGNCRKWATAGPYLSSASYPALFDSPTRTFSIAWWMAVHSTTVGTTLFSIRRPLTTSHHLFALYLAGASTYALGVKWSTAPSSQVTWNTNVQLPSAGGVWHHHCVTVNANVATYYVNGSLVGTNNLLTPVLKEAAYTYQMSLGRGAFDATPEQTANTSLDDFRIYDAVLTADEVWALYQVNPSADTTAPVISAVSPTDGSAISRTQAWSFRVTDNVAFRRTVVVVTLTDTGGTERGREVIYDGTEFAALYSAGSTKTTISAGTVFDFSIVRAGGWPFAPTFDVFAIDTSGNEGT